MKTFIVLFALVAIAASAAVREKRGWGEPSYGWGEQSEGWGEQLDGWKSGWDEKPKTKIIVEKKVVNVQREITVPQVVQVRKIINEPKVIIIKKEVPVESSQGWW